MGAQATDHADYSSNGAQKLASAAILMHRQAVGRALINGS